MCEFTSGRSETPCDSPAGLEESYGFDRKEVATYTVTDGVVTALTLNPGKYIHPIKYEAETGNFQDVASGTSTNSSYARTHTSTMVLAGNTSEDVVWHEAAGKTRVCVAHKLEDGSLELLHAGKGGKWIDDRTSGTALEDLNGTTVTVTSKEKNKAPKIPWSIIQPLLAPAS